VRRAAFVALCIGVSFGLSCGVAAANECPGNPDALGTSRVLTLGTAGHVRIGTMQYPNTLPLAEKEVVLTFDDGPLPPYTESILETLASECVKANYFIVGRMARAHPDLVRRIRADGHIVGTHTENHPRHFDRVAKTAMESEIEDGIASVAAALGDPKAVAPFFRAPGLRRSDGLEAHLARRGLAIWSADVPADD
jgi:peptidoglycan/xylan/chitin deacetylase (PgdA/CDA1 family)